MPNSSDCRRVVETTVERFGGVDILFNNVGIQPPASYTNVEDTSEDMWDRIIGVNLKSCFLMSKYSIPEMRKRGGGVIINTASVQGLQSQPLVPPYAASKGGILSLTRQMSIDYAKDNIRVLAVCPGSIDTPMLRAAAGVVDGPDPDEVVDCLGSGASDRASGDGSGHRERRALPRQRQGELHDGRERQRGRRVHGARRVGDSREGLRGGE